MAEKEERIVELVREEILRNPDAKTSDVYEAVKTREPSVGELKVRQFQGRYFLRVKNQLRREAKERGEAPSAKKAAPGRKARKAPGRPARRKAAAPRRRTRAPGRRTGDAAAAPAGGGPEGVARREAFRQVLIEFSRDVAAAEDNRQLLDVVSRMDQYIDRLEELM